MTESIVLKVGMAQRQSEAGYGRARIDTESRRALGLDIGDTIEIVGKRTVVAKVFKCDPEDEGKGMIFIDGLTRTSAGVSVDENVNVRHCEPLMAEQVVLAPNIPDGKKIRFEKGIEDIFLRGLMARPLVAGTDIIVPNIALMGNRSTFTVVSTIPPGPVLVTGGTQIVLRDSPIAHLVQDVNIALKAQGVGAPLFHAVKLSEMDEIETQMHPELVKMVDEFKSTFKDDTFGTDLEAVVADARYKYISANYSSAYTRRGAKGEKLTKSDKADKVLTHRVWGIPIFIVILFVIFHLTFSEDLFYISAIAGGLPTLEDLGMNMENGAVTLLACFYDGAVFSPGVIFTNLLNWVLEWINVLAEMACANAAPWVGSFIVDGILGGVFAVLGFIPQILTLFLFFSILEDTGYMARIAFILDRIFRKFGLSGRAFMPMIMGFGCSLPAMINTRTLADEKERTSTVRVITTSPASSRATMSYLTLATSSLPSSGNTATFTATVYTRPGSSARPVERPSSPLPIVTNTVPGSSHEASSSPILVPAFLTSTPALPTAPE